MSDKEKTNGSLAMAPRVITIPAANQETARKLRVAAYTVSVPTPRIKNTPLPRRMPTSPNSSQTTLIGSWQTYMPTRASPARP